MKPIIKTTKEVQDMGVTAASIATGLKPIKLVRVNKQKVLFIFEDTAELREVIQRYFSFNLQVDAQTMFNALRSLKSQIYSGDIDIACERRENSSPAAGKKKPAYVQALEEGCNFKSP